MSHHTFGGETLVEHSLAWEWHPLPLEMAVHAWVISRLVTSSWSPLGNANNSGSLSGEGHQLKITLARVDGAREPWKAIHLGEGHSDLKPSKIPRHSRSQARLRKWVGWGEGQQPIPVKNPLSYEYLSRNQPLPSSGSTTVIHHRATHLRH